MRLVAVIGDPHIGAQGKKVLFTGHNARFMDLLKSLGNALKDAQDRGVVATVIAGDTFDRHKPTPTEIAAVGRVLSDYKNVIIIPGNHDTPKSAAEVAPIVLLVDDARSIYPVFYPQCIDMAGWTLHCLPYPSRHWASVNMPDYAQMSPEEVDYQLGEHVKTILQGWAKGLIPEEPSLLVGHIALDVAEAGGHHTLMADKDITIGLQDVPDDFTFSVFGHIHKHQTFDHFGRHKVMYAGSIDRMDFGEEDEAKGYVLCDLDSGEWEFVPLECRKWRTFNIAYGSDTNWNNGDGFDPSDIKDSICRVVIKRPENVKPDINGLEKYVRDAGCFDFRGFKHEVDKVSAVRCKEIRVAATLDERLALWHEAKQCPIPLPQLLWAADEVEKEVAA